MKITLSLTIFWIFNSLITCSLESKIGSNWFKLLLDKTGVRRGYKLDFMLSMIFLKQQKNTSVFSPLCCDMNILVQCIEGEFGHIHSSKGKEDLKCILDKLRSIVCKSFNLFTCFHKKDETSENDVTLNMQYKLFSMFNAGYLLEKYYKGSILSVADLIIKKHSKWLEKTSYGLFTTPLTPSLLLSTDRIYSSFIYYNDIWANKIDENESYEGEFKLYNGKICLRKFIRKKNWFKYVKISRKDLEYEIVSVPYESRIYRCTCKMVYLIPSTHNTDLSKLWDDFYSFTKGSINYSMTYWEFKKIDLHIPTLENIRSSFNLIDLLYDVFKHNKAFSINSSMTTYLNINGICGKEDELMIKKSSKEHLVEADKPYISFIVDWGVDRVFLWYVGSLGPIWKNRSNLKIFKGPPLK